jgi:hypothetical protein
VVWGARPFEQQRQAALASSDTLYCYDFLELLERAVQIKVRAWVNALMSGRLICSMGLGDGHGG